MASACGDGATKVPDPCAGLTCSGHGTCAVANGKAVCACAAGYDPQGLECVPNQTGSDAGTDPEDSDAGSTHPGDAGDTDPGGLDAGRVDAGRADAGGTNPCDGVTCSSHGTCASVSGKAACTCDRRYHANGLACVPDSPPAFKVFDSLELTGKPGGLDAQYGLLRMTQHNEDQGWWAGAPGGQSAAAPTQAVFDAAIASANGIIPFSSDGYHFLDWEGFWTLFPWNGDAAAGPYTNTNDSAQKFVLSAKRHRQALNKTSFASQKFGFYGLPVDSYWAFNGDSALVAGVEDQVQKFADLGFASGGVDFIALAHYTFYDDEAGWDHHIEGATALVRAAFPGVPVYIFLWPRWHDSSATPFQELPATTWRHQLDKARTLADGVILWDSSHGSWAASWDENAAWWQTTKAWLKANGH